METKGGTVLQWDHEFRIKHRIYKDAKRSQESISQARKGFRCAVRKAKREYWRKQAENCTTDNVVFRLMKWTKPKTSQEPHSLKMSSGKWISDPSKIAEHLQDNLLARFNAECDLTYLEADQRESVLWNTVLTIEEVVGKTG